MAVEKTKSSQGIMSVSCDYLHNSKCCIEVLNLRGGQKRFRKDTYKENQPDCAMLDNKNCPHSKGWLHFTQE